MQVTGLLRRMSPVHAALLVLLAFSIVAALPVRRDQAAANVNAIGPAAAVPSSVEALLALTADSQSLVTQSEAAKLANAELPLTINGLQAANPFDLSQGFDLAVADRAQQCLALAMYYEAAFEGRDGRLAVAQVVLNRVRHPAFPHDVCGVVFQRSAGNVCQFSFACDGAMRRPKQPVLWRETLAEAGAALHGKVYAGVGMATHYHANYVFPKWAPQLEKVAVIGQHVFYRWPGGWGQRRAFTATYDGAEPALDLSVIPEPEQSVVFPAELSAAAGEVAPIQSANEAGFVDPSKGWVPRISQPGLIPAPDAPAGAAPAAVPAP